MTGLLIFHPLLRKGWNAMFPLSPPSSVSNPKLAQGAARLHQRTVFDFVFALIYLSALHGVSVVKIMFILWMNYQLAMSLPRKSVPYATWIFNVGVLFANEFADGYKFKTAAALFSPSVPPGVDLGPDTPFLMKWANFLDSMGGLLSRWQVSFNICVLRLISFNLDYYWSQDRGHVNSVEVGPPLSPPRVLEDPS
jgi:protein-cysteine N-palmitoyltransferase HHAT